MGHRRPNHPSRRSCQCHRDIWRGEEIYPFQKIQVRITNVCGTTLFDFSQADIQGAVVIDISQLFGEVKIKVPVGWHVVIKTTNIFATVDDRRKNTGVPIDYNKVLVLKGVNVCATVVIKAAI